MDNVLWVKVNQKFGTRNAGYRNDEVIIGFGMAVS